VEEIQRTEERFELASAESPATHDLDDVVQDSGEIFQRDLIAPGDVQLKKGICIDLTGSADDILKGKTPCKTVTGPPGPTVDDEDQVQYAIVPGEKMKAGEVKDCKNLAN
jgi:hypothetical protein